MNEDTQTVTPQWFRTASYVMLAAILCGVVGVVLALLWKLIRWILA